MPGPIQGAFPQTWTFPELTGNSQFTLVGTTLWLIGETEGYEINASTLNAGGVGYVVNDTGTINGGVGGTYIVNSVISGIIVSAGLASPGNSYVVGDTGSISGGTGGTYTVTAVNTDGGVTAVTLHITGTTGYSTGLHATTTGGGQPGIGTGLTVRINTVINGQVVTYSITAPGNGYLQGVASTSTGGAQPGVGAGLLLNLTVIETDFSYFSSTDYGISWTKIGDFTFAHENLLSFDPAVCSDTSGKVHFIGTRTGYTGSVANGTVEVVKFTLDTTGPTLTGPFVITTGEEVQGDYDILPLSSGNTFAVVGTVTPDVADALVGIEIGTSGSVVSTTTIVSSPSRSGLIFGAVSILTPNGTDLEVYYTQHPKVITFNDMNIQINLIQKVGGSFGSPATFRTVVARQPSTKFTVQANGNIRYLTYCYYTQSRAGLAGNSLFGTQPDVTVHDLTTWTFHAYIGTPTASIVEPTLTVGVTTLTLAYITRDQTLAPIVGTDAPVTVADLNSTTFQLSIRTDFRNPPHVSWLRGTKDVLPDTTGWAFLGETQSSGTASFFSGFNVAPVAFISPLTLTAFRQNSYIFDGSQSSDANGDPIQYEWTITYAAWVATHAYSSGNSIVDPGGFVQTVTTPGTSGGSIPTFNETLNGTTTDGGVTWTNTGTTADVTLTPHYPPNSTSATTVLFIPNDIGPQQLSATITLGVVDIGTDGNPIHTPPSGPAIATSAVTIAFVTAPSITWPTNPIMAARNSFVTLAPTIVVDPHTFPVYTFQQIAGTTVSQGGNGTTLVVPTAGVDVEGETLTFRFTVNDGVNPAISADVNVDVAAYDFVGFDSNVLARSNFTTDGSTPANIASRNTPQTWTTPANSTLFTDMTSIKRSDTLTGQDRFISISRWSVLLYSFDPTTSTTILRRLLIPTTNGADKINDAVHTEQDYTLVLTNAQILYRYSTAPLINTDNPDISLDLTTLTTFVVTQIFTTATFANVRVLLLTGPNGLVLLQVDSDTLAVTGKLEISKESALLYGADNVQFVRQSNVESIHSGKILIGTIGGDGVTYETLVDLPHKLILGTWDKTKLRNQTVASGEILFEPFTGYVGLPTAPTLNPITTDVGYDGLLTWSQERPDLVQAYNIFVSIDGGGYTLLSTVSSGLIQNYTTMPLNRNSTYSFKLNTVTADGTSGFSNVQTLIPIANTPAPVLTISSITTSYPQVTIVQQATTIWLGTAGDRLTLPNPVTAGNELIFVSTAISNAAQLVDNLSNNYTLLERYSYALATNSGSVTVSPDPASSSFTTGPVFLLELANGAAPLVDGQLPSGVGSGFGLTYNAASNNSMELLLAVTDGSLISNPFTRLIGSGTTLGLGGPGSAMNLGEIDVDFVGQYPVTFSQTGSGQWQLVAVNVPSQIIGSAHLTWTQAELQNVASYTINSAHNIAPIRQSKLDQTNGGTISFPAPTTIGNTVLLVVFGDHGGDLSPDFTRVLEDTPNLMSVYLALDTSVNYQHISYAFSNSVSLIALEIEGVFAFDQIASAVGTSPTPGVTFTTTTANQIILGFAKSAATNLTADTGYTPITFVPTTILAEYKNASLAGAQNPGFTSSNNSWEAIGISLKFIEASQIPITTIPNPNTMTADLRLPAQFVNGGVFSSNFSFSVTANLIGGGNTGPSNAVPLSFPLHATITNSMTHNSPFSADLNVTAIDEAGNPPYVWTVIAGAPPVGVTLSSNGLLSGTPTTIGSVTYIVQITDSLGVMIDVIAIATVS